MRTRYYAKVDWYGKIRSATHAGLTGGDRGLACLFLASSSRTPIYVPTWDSLNLRATVANTQDLH